MKKIYLLLIPGLFAFTGFAQKSTDKKVTSTYIQLPPYDASSVDPASLVIDFAAGPVTFGTEKMSDTKTICKKSGQAVSKESVVEVTTYYYAIPMNTPASYLVARGADGTVLYANEVSAAGTGSIDFGKDKCEYWVADKMKKDYASGGESFKSKEASKFVNGLYDQAKIDALQKLNISLVSDEFSLYSAKGKDVDYADIESAFEKATSAFENIKKAGPNDADFKTLNDCIAVWEKELESTDAENKDARINKKVAIGLHENCFNAYMYTFQYDKAKKHGETALSLWGNFSNNQTATLQARMNQMRILKTAGEMNSSLLTDLSALNAKANASKSVKLTVNKLGEDAFPKLQSEFNAHGMSTKMDQYKEDKAEYDEKVASGEVNPYEKYVTETATQGKIIMMSPLTMAPELTELPAEMCAITDLKQINITSNKIASIHPDIKNLQDLEKLNLNGNQLTSLPAEIGELKKLETLNLNKNPLTEIPEEIKNCSSLKTVNLKETNLSAEMQAKLAEWLPDAKIKY